MADAHAGWIPPHSFAEAGGKGSRGSDGKGGGRSGGRGRGENGKSDRPPKEDRAERPTRSERNERVARSDKHESISAGTGCVASGSHVDSSATADDSALGVPFGPSPGASKAVIPPPFTATRTPTVNAWGQSTNWAQKFAPPAPTIDLDTASPGEVLGDGEGEEDGKGADRGGRGRSERGAVRGGTGHRGKGSKSYEDEAGLPDGGRGEGRNERRGRNANAVREAETCGDHARTATGRANREGRPKRDGIKCERGEGDASDFSPTPPRLPDLSAGGSELALTTKMSAALADDPAILHVGKVGPWLPVSHFCIY